MIENCSILRIDVPVASAGEAAWANGSAIAAGGLRGFAGSIQNEQKYLLGAKISQADRVLSVMKADLTAAGLTAPVQGGRLQFQADGADEGVELGVILLRRDFVLNDISHFEFYLKGVPNV